MTTILKSVPKYGLDWWGFRLGIQAAQAAANGGHVDLTAVTPDDLYEKVKELARAGHVDSPRTALKQAGKRGNSVHDVAEALFRGQGMPPKNTIDPDQVGFVQSLWEFHKQFIQPRRFNIVAVEEPVFSLRCPPDHVFPGYAGTLDLILYDTETDIYYLLDWKTSKGIYENHLLQLPPYRQGAIECGWIPDDANTVMSVIRLSPDGKFGPDQVAQSPCTLPEFLDFKKTWERMLVMTGKDGR